MEYPPNCGRLTKWKLRFKQLGELFLEYLFLPIVTPANRGGTSANPNAVLLSWRAVFFHLLQRKPVLGFY